MTRGHICHLDNPCCPSYGQHLGNTQQDEPEQKLNQLWFLFRICPRSQVLFLDGESLNWPNTLSVTCCVGICANLHWESTIVGIFVFLLFLPLVIPAHPRYWHNIIPSGETGPRRDKQTWRNVFFFSFLNQNQKLEMIDLLCVWRKNWTKKRMMCLRSGCVQIEVHLG